MFFRAFIALLTLVPMAMPWAAAASDKDLSRFLCNPSGQTQTVKADEKLVEFLTAIGEIDKDKTDRQIEHCSNCILLNSGLPSGPSYYSETTRFPDTVRHWPINNVGLIYGATGPPLGGRAPPIFL